MLVLQLPADCDGRYWLGWATNMFLCKTWCKSNAQKSFRGEKELVKTKLGVHNALCREVVSLRMQANIKMFGDLTIK